MQSSNLISVAVIDTGIDPERVNAAHLLPGLNLSDEGESDETIDYGTHGTAIAQTILQIAPEVRIVPIKIVNRQGILRNLEAMSIAFEWILEHHDRLNIRVVCAAIADTTCSKSDEYYAEHPLRPLIARLRDAQVATVAAAGNWYTHHHRQGMAFPAILREVISVGAISQTAAGVQLSDHSQRLHPSAGRGCYTTFFVEPGAPGDTSGAAATVSGRLANLAQPQTTVDQWLEQLEQSCQIVHDEDGLEWKII
jgi:hypothetical protein